MYFSGLAICLRVLQNSKLIVRFQLLFPDRVDPYSALLLYSCRSIMLSTEYSRRRIGTDGDAARGHYEISARFQDKNSIVVVSSGCLFIIPGYIDC
jgi:hypothetical protein